MVPYSYTLLRYVHDPVAGERVNVGVFLASGKGGFVGMMCDEGALRLKGLYSDFDHKAYTAVTGHVVQAVKDLAGTIEAATEILPSDDSAFQWSEAGSGICEDPALQLEKLYNRFVSRKAV